MTKPIEWDQPATLIDLAGKAPLISTIQECVRHFSALKAVHREEARILLTYPVHREGQKTRTWLLNPNEIAAWADQLRALQN
ncbi:hypothetical protein LWE61_18075 [Sphingobium sufflavum]|uniref:hypothetical protein n=1 Tax=Sphingobium sufflavum TaxID=1129547 RepID=UPI001F3B115A|nr:hypothetical protein [Sphingobium sufflavum]MCE7798449.1 hypothetical protein [Sphingobium sufflavum]